MKTRLTQWGLLLVASGLLLVFSTCKKEDSLTGDTASAQAYLKSGNGPSVHGLGIYTNVNWGGTSHHKLNVVTLPDGSVTGSGELKHYQVDYRYLQYTVTCLTVTGNEAVVGGYVTESIFELVPVGARVFVRVVDNGQGGSAQDLITGVWYENCPGWDPEWSCDNFALQPLIAIEKGNLVVND